MRNFLSRLVTFILMITGRPLRTKHEMLKAADVIIVLGTRMRSDGIPSEGMFLRVRHAAVLLNQGLSESGKLILSGRGKGNALPEAQVMSDVARSLGLKEDTLLLETQSQGTADNALRSKQIMDQEGWHSAIVVTSPYHVRRAVKSFRSLGIKAFGVEAFSPTQYPLVTHFKVIVHEYIAWLNWWLEYTLQNLSRGFVNAIH